MIDHRYPEFRTKVVEYAFTGTTERLVDAASRRLVTHGAREQGYVVEASWLAPGDDSDKVHFLMNPDGQSRELTAAHLGFTSTVTVGASILGTRRSSTGFR